MNIIPLACFVLLLVFLLGLGIGFNGGDKGGDAEGFTMFLMFVTAVFALVLGGAVLTLYTLEKRDLLKPSTTIIEDGDR